MTRGGGNSVVSALRERMRPAAGFERPRLFDIADDRQAGSLESLLTSYPGIVVHDQMASQIESLLHARDPSGNRGRDRRGEAREYLADRGADVFGRWVFFPWRNAVVRILPEAEFVELRSARNQLHLTPREQRVLRRKTIGIVGLSVGASIAVTMAMEGVGGRFRLADFDGLDLSNTNRVSAGVTGLGHNKAVLAARAMFEIDPYLRIDVYEEGIRGESCGSFLADDGGIDVLIEECDDLSMKLRLREMARRLSVPVLTETSQRGLLDVERYDLEPSRPPFHGLMGEMTAERLRELSTRDKAPFILRFMEGTSNMSASLLASLLEIERSLAGWPQLGSAVALGGAVVTDVTRRLLLGRLRRSGRFRVDLEAIVSDSAEAAMREPLCQVDESPRSPAAGKSTARHEDRLSRWVRAATMAPSGGNVQPWHFQELAGGGIACRLGRRGQGSALDPDRMAARVACAAAFINLQLVARREGYDVEVSWEPDRGDPGLLYTCRFHPDSSLEPDPLTECVSQRCTNRRLTKRRPLPPESLAALEREAHEHGGGLVVHQSEASLGEVAEVLGELDRVRVFSRPLYDEMMAELVDTPAAREGIAIETLELDPTDRAALEILRRREVVELLRDQGRGRAFAELAERPVRAASAVCMLHVPGCGSGAFLRGGVALQRVWLRATQLGLAVQPISAGLYMLAQLRGRRCVLEDVELRALQAIEPRFVRCFPVPAGHTGILVFRLTLAEPPRVRSARLSLDAIFERIDVRPAAIAT